MLSGEEKGEEKGLSPIYSAGEEKGLSPIYSASPNDSSQENQRILDLSPYSSAAANPYADFNGSNSLTMRYLYGPAVVMIVVRRDTSGTVAWYLADHLGTVRDIASMAGTILDHTSYSAFGKVTAGTNPSNGDRFTYTARERESENSLYHYRARYYDYSTGRFVEEDPIQFLGRDANLYRFVANSPMTGSDPSGQIPLLVVLGLVIIAGGAGYAGAVGMGGTGPIGGFSCAAAVLVVVGTTVILGPVGLPGVIALSLAYGTICGGGVVIDVLVS